MLRVVVEAIVGVTSLLQATLKVTPLSAVLSPVLASATKLPKPMAPSTTSQPEVSVALTTTLPGAFAAMATPVADTIPAAASATASAFELNLNILIPLEFANF
jgi:hypothetical protein